MKYLIITMILITSLFGNFDWPSDYDEALESAKKEKKDIYLMIGSANCPWCEKFENTVLEDKAVYKKLTKNYVPLYLSRDIDDIPEQFKTSPIPRHYFIDENGEIIEGLMGYRGIPCFNNIIDDVNELRKRK
mgnify:CR=1 FL=1